MLYLVYMLWPKGCERNRTRYISLRCNMALLDHALHWLLHQPLRPLCPVMKGCLFILVHRLINAHERLLIHSSSLLHQCDSREPQRNGIRSAKSSHEEHRHESRDKRNRHRDALASSVTTRRGNKCMSSRRR